MTQITRGLDLLLWSVGACGWGFAVFVLMSRFVDTTLGVLLGLAVSTSSLAWVFNSHMHEQRMKLLAQGSCPGCHSPIKLEHRHRHWDAGARSWAAAATSWDCDACHFSHSESWACPDCPEAQ